MLRSIRTPFLGLAVAFALALGTGQATAQVVVTPAPVVTYYYTPPSVSYVPAPRPAVAYYYAPPTVSYYAAPVVAYAPPVAVAPYASSTTTYRYGLFYPRREVNVTRYYYAP